MHSRTILLVQLASDLSGSPLSGLDIARCLLRQGHRVVVAFGSDGPVVARYSAAGCEVTVLPHKNWLRRPGFLHFLKDFFTEILRMRSFLALMRNNKIDLVYVNSTVSLAPVLAARLGRIPVVWHLRELFAEVGGELRVPRLLRPCVQRIVERLPNRVLANSRATAQNVLGEQSGNTAKVLFNMLSDAFLDNLPSREEARLHMGCGANDWVLGIPGTLRPSKGHLFLLESCAGWLRDNPQVKVLVSGDATTEYGQELHARVAAAGLAAQFHFTGVVDNMAQFLRACDLACVPSKAEPFGRVAVEAFACSVPLVASGHGGIQEIVRDGENGILVRHGDKEGLLAAIQLLFANPGLARQLADTAKRDFVEKFSEAPFCNRLAGILAPYLEAKAR